MSDLLLKIQNDLKKAMLEKNEVQLSTIRMLKSALKNAEIDNKGQALTADEVMSVIQKQIKSRQDAKAEYEKASRPDLAKKEAQEMEVLSSYLPKQLSDTELAREVEQVLSQSGFSSKKDFRNAMKVLRDKLQGQATNQRISAELQRRLV